MHAEPDLAGRFDKQRKLFVEGSGRVRKQRRQVGSRRRHGKRCLDRDGGAAAEQRAAVIGEQKRVVAAVRVDCDAAAGCRGRQKIVRHSERYPALERADIRRTAVVETGRRAVHIGLINPEIDTRIDRGAHRRRRQAEVAARRIEIQRIRIQIARVECEVRLAQRISRTGHRVSYEVIRFRSYRAARNPDPVAGAAGDDVVVDDGAGTVDRDAVARRPVNRIVIQHVVRGDHNFVGRDAVAVGVNHVADDLRSRSIAPDP